VTKTQSAEDVRTLILAGVNVIGENRVQELLAKAPLLRDLPHQTHLIGHLQRNKARYLPGQVDMVQSVAAAGTVDALERAWDGCEGRLDVLVEVNIGGEVSKSGADVGRVRDVCARVCASQCLRLRGLMAIPPFVEGEKIRKYFAQMHHLFVDIKGENMDNDTVNVLSMGMSSDFEEAIAEGATMVRVGTELFGPRV
jgi:pyridoxal phosphate enzyme (YggS family)